MPADDEDIMPPEGDPLTKEQITSVRRMNRLRSSRVSTTDLHGRVPGDSPRFGAVAGAFAPASGAVVGTRAGARYVFMSRWVPAHEIRRD